MRFCQLFLISLALCLLPACSQSSQTEDRPLTAPPESSSENPKKEEQKTAKHHQNSSEAALPDLHSTTPSRENSPAPQPSLPTQSGPAGLRHPPLPDMLPDF